MTRFRWCGVLTGVVLTMAACSDARTANEREVLTVVPPTASSAPAAPAASVATPASGLARIQTAEGLLTVDLGTGKTEFLEGLVNADWTRVASVDNGVARLVEAGSRQEMRKVNVPDGLTVAAISADGTLIAYSTAPEPGVPGLPKGRATTRVAIVSSWSTTVQVLDLEGNLVPEAFSSDGRDLFVLDYVPATAPDHYEVRMIDLVNGTKSDVGGRPKEPADTEQMQGNVRNSVYSTNHEMLFTLYSEYGDEGHAFIHALNLNEKWSYCIDLPDKGRFGDGQSTLTASSDNKLYVVGDSGQIAEIDAQPYGLTVDLSVQLPAATPAKTRTTAAVEGNRLIVGQDDRVYFVDRRTLRLDTTLTMNSAVIGLTGDGHGRVGIATAKAIDVVDSAADTHRTGLQTTLPAIVRFGLE